VITQVALSLVALISAGLFVRSLWEAYKADPDLISRRSARFVRPVLSGYDESRGASSIAVLSNASWTVMAFSRRPWRDACPSPMANALSARIDGYAPAKYEDMRRQFMKPSAHGIFSDDAYPVRAWKGLP